MSKKGVKKTQGFRKLRMRVKLEERDGVIGKLCTGECGEWRPLDSYAVSKKGLGGKTQQCKLCTSLYRKNHYEENREKVLEDRKFYYQENYVKVRERQQKYRDEASDKIAEYKRKYYLKNRNDIAERVRNYRLSNSEKIAERNKNWCIKNPDKVREIQRRYYTKNKDERLQRSRAWLKNNHEKALLYNRCYRTRKTKLPNTLTNKQYNITLKHFGNACALTGNTLKIEMEHAIPLSIGQGGTTFGNCYPLSKELNISKFNHNIFEWFEANRQRFEISQEHFDNLIAWLASANAMTVEEYRDHVYWCHANPRNIDELESANDGGNRQAQ